MEKSGFRFIPVKVRDSEEVLTVEYRENRNPEEAGFDLMAVSFQKGRCIGYPVLHAYFKDMKAMGNRRYCGFIQFVERTEITAKDGNEYTEKTLSVDVSSDFEKTGNPYYSYGFPASLYDAPCCNLGNCDKLIWRAYTFLTDMPSRMNENCLSFLMGFSWGYVEDGKGVCGLLDFEILPKTEWKRFCNFLSEKYPELKIENG